VKVYLVNDCTSWPKWGGGPDGKHHGCEAIIKSLTHRIQAAGHEIVAVCKRPDGPTRESIELSDMLIVNGEGTFRDEAKDYEPGRISRLKEGIKLAKEMGKRVYLVNTVWCSMYSDWASILRSLDGIAVREPESARQIEYLSGVTPEGHPDESFFLDVPPNTLPMKWNGDVRGDFYPNNIRDGINPDMKMLARMKHIGLFTTDWVSAVKQLRFSYIYVTGQHHGVYAACKARTPFAACRVNTHKLTSLFEWAGVRIPVASTWEELAEAIYFARKERQEFTKLFDFLEAQKPWKIPES